MNILNLSGGDDEHDIHLQYQELWKEDMIWFM